MHNEEFKTSKYLAVVNPARQFGHDMHYFRVYRLLAKKNQFLKK